MTRWLSEVLQAPEPAFRHSLRKLEAANGHPNTDIRFSVAAQQEAGAKLRELGLDPRDTTAKELYHALQARIADDDARLVKRLRTEAAQHVSAEGRVDDGLVRVVRQAASKQACLALKAASLKALLRAQTPKKAMRQLGYRSLDSLLKHESPALIVAAAWLTEGDAWQRRWIDQYAKLKPNDFETRPLSVLQPTGKKWPALAAQVARDRQHNLLVFKELATMVVLPLPDEAPSGAATASLALALHALNDIRASSSFLKLSQVRPDFGQQVKTVAIDEPRLLARELDEPVAWRLIQNFYSRLQDKEELVAFGPHVTAEDLDWDDVEQTLAEIEPRFAFWQRSGHLAWLHQRAPVSLNLVDVALNYCNARSFEHRLTHYFQQSIRHELLLHYLKHDTVEQTVLAELAPAAAISA